MSAPIQLETHPRDAVGSRAARKERSAGRVPVIVYGHGRPNVTLTVDAHALGVALHTAAQVFLLEIGSQSESCLLKEVHYDVYGQHVLHVDFTRVDLSEEVEVEVTLQFRGQAKGVLAGGIQIVHHLALAVRCRADSIPDALVVDVSALEKGQAVHAGEVSLPPGVALDVRRMALEEPLVAVAEPRIEAEPEPEQPVEGEVKPGEAAPAEGEAKAEDAAKGAKDAKGGGPKEKESKGGAKDTKGGAKDTKGGKE